MQHRYAHKYKVTYRHPWFRTIVSYIHIFGDSPEDAKQCVMQDGVANVGGKPVIPTEIISVTQLD
jgi:hypothetical protein